jgi:ABC-type sugar transport system ATPase subunit
VLEVSVRKQQGQFALDANIRDSGFVCLSGRNGSGKTTFLRIVAGLSKPDSGAVRVGGKDVTGLSPDKRGVIMVTPASAIAGKHVDGHLVWGARLKGKSVPEERLRDVKQRLGIDFAGRVEELSLGMRERVALATALIALPSVILVDEAFANLHARDEFIEAYRTLTADAGIDVVFSTQDAADGELADHLYLMEAGRVVRKF